MNASWTFNAGPAGSCNVAVFARSAGSAATWEAIANKAYHEDAAGSQTMRHNLRVGRLPIPIICLFSLRIQGKIRRSLQLVSQAFFPPRETEKLYLAYLIE